MTEKIALRVQHKRMTKEDWLKSDAILLEGEIGVESDTGYIKAGNGTDYFPDLPYLSGPPGIIIKGQFDYLEDLKNTYPTGNFGEGYQIKNEDKTVYAWCKRHTTKNASGSAITLEDSATANLKGLRLYGRSWQDGEPSIEEPKEIHSVDNAEIGILGCNAYDFASKLDSGYCYLNDRAPLVENGEISFNAEGLSGWNKRVGIQFDRSFFLKNNVLLNNEFIFSFKSKNKINYDSECFGKAGSANGINNENNSVGYRDIKIKKTGDTYYFRVKFNLESWYPAVMIYSVGGIKDTIYDLKLTLKNVFSEDEFIEPQEIDIPHKLNAVPVDDGGNYTDNDGQQWVADYVDFDRGVLVKRCEKHSLSGVHSINLNSNNFISAFFALGTNILISNVSKVSVWGTLDKTHESTWYHSKDSCGILLNKNRLSTPDLKGVKKWCSDNNAYFLSANDDSIEIPLSDSELEAYAKLHTLYPYTTVLNDQGAYMEVDYQSTEVEGEWLDVGKFHTNTNDVTQLQADMLMKANKRDLVDDVPRINELEGKIKELSSKIDRIVANGT